MASERDFELLDDYLGNRLSGEEKVAFEKRIEGDPELKREFTVQQNIVEGIKRARLAELKGMLQNTPVPAPPIGQTMFAKVGMLAVVAGLIATAVWFFSKDQVEVKQESAPIAEQAPETVKDEPEAAELIDETAKQEEPAVEEKATVKEEKKVTSKTKKRSAEPVQPKRPEVSELTPESEESSSAKYVTQPSFEQLKEAPVRESKNSSIAIENVADNKKYTFHYQFKQGNLVLYGPAFSSKDTYEILEFFVGKKQTTVILYHQNDYYLLNRDVTEVVELTPIKDPALVNMLNDKRKIK